MQFLNLTFNRLIFLLIISLLSACNSKTVTTPSKRGVKPVLVQDIQGSKFLYSSSHALLIGESDYTNGWDDLNSIPGELQDVKNVLESQGFQVEMRLNLNARQLREQFKTFIDNYGFKNNNRLLFFFSGHGHTRNDKGYIVPTDAPDPNLDKIGFLRKAVGMDQILTWARRIEAKHVLFLFDSCFSGTVFKSKGKSSVPPKIQRWTKLPVRQFITAGSANETVPARSVFTPAFVDAIRYGWGDTYQDGYITGEELAYYLKNKVSDHSDQNPQSGTIKDYELSRGDFVFVLADKKPNVTPIPQPPKPAIITITPPPLNNHSIQTSIEGSCEGYWFPLQRDGKSINTALPLRVLRNNAPVYYEAHGYNKKTTLKFGDVLDALRISYSRTSGRVEICKSGCLPDEALGWMDRQDLLCRIKPLKNKQGLERKAFIKTPPQPEIVEQGRIRVKKTNVTAYSCYNDSCKTSKNSLSRFEMYFIFAEKQQRYLLADKYNLLMGPPLIGWVDKNKMIPWNTRLQIRPREEVKYIRAYPDLPTAYISRSSSNLRKAVDLAGGNIWYKFPLHVPLLDIKNYKGKKYYHVSAPGIGIRGFDIKSINQQTATVAQLKQVDVFFLLDGTRSMQAFLDAAKNFANKIVKKFSKRNNKPNYQETHFRFGFRVYRNKSIGKGLPLSGSCKPKANITKKSVIKFNREIAFIKESNEKSNTKSLLNGLRQAVKDMANCPNRVKILFVIGNNADHEKQVANSLIKKLTQRFVRLFFIQTHKNGNNHQINKHLIVQYVSKYSKSSIINELMLRLRAGQSVKDIIEQGMKEGDLPVLYWEILEKDLCQAAKKQCKPSVDHRVIDAYIPVSKNIVEEIWISSRELNNWKILLRPLYHKIESKGIIEQKRDFIKILEKETQNILGEPLLMEAGETLGEVLKRKNGLPVREHTPFMQYTKGEILNMQQCEFHRLTKWIEDIFHLLTRLTANPTKKIEYELSPYADSQCPHVSAKGKNLKRLKLKSPKPLGPSDEYRYDHHFRGETIYTIPIDFLP